MSLEAVGPGLGRGRIGRRGPRRGGRNPAACALDFVRRGPPLENVADLPFGQAAAVHLAEQRLAAMADRIRGRPASRPASPLSWSSWKA